MAKAWNRDDTLLVLASFLDRPRGMRLPPVIERERVANLVRRDVTEITDRMQTFLDLESDGAADPIAARLWDEFASHPLECGIAADEVMAARRKVPHHLRKKMDQP